MLPTAPFQCLQMAVADLVKPSKAEKVPEKGMKDTVKTKDGKHAEDPQPPAIGTIKYVLWGV